MATDISELERDAIDDGVKVSRLLRHTGPGSYVMRPPIWGTLPGIWRRRQSFRCLVAVGILPSVAPA